MSNFSKVSSEVGEKRLDHSLSGRERELLILAAQGLTDQGISSTLGISVGTVGTYWGRVRIKFGPMSRTELVAVYLNEQSQDALEDLRGKVSGLLTQIQDHIQVEEALAKSRELFRGLIETAPDAIVVVYSDGSIRLANQEAERMFGYGREELIGICVEVLVPDRHRESHVKSRKEYEDDPIQRRIGDHLTTLASRKDGSEFPVAMALSSSETTEGILVTCIVRDLTIHLENQRSL